MDNAEAQGHATPAELPPTSDREAPVSGPVVAQTRERRRRRRRGGIFRVARRTRRQFKQFNWLLIVAIAVGIAAAIVMGALILTINAQRQVDHSWQGLRRDWESIGNTPMTELTPEDFDRLQVRVRDLNSSLQGAKSKTAFLRPFTFASADLDTTLESLDAAQELGLAANDILAGLRPMIFFLGGGEEEETLAPQFSSGARLVELITLGQSRFHSAQRHLDAAQAMVDNITLAEVSPDVFLTLDGLVQYHDQLSKINATLLDGPALLDNALGVTEPRTYLILAQNSDELRPAGGYISTYGWIQVERGRVIRYDYYPTTPSSPNPPDSALAAEIDLPEWWIPFDRPIYAAWDGSWSPDFPTTASMAAWYYEQGNNPQAPVDGVIAIDIVGFEYLLQGLGKVVVPGYNETVTPENFREMIYRIRAEGEGDLPHKQFLTALFRQIFDDWQNVDPAKGGDLRRAMVQALQEKHVMIYMDDDNLNRALDVLGWAGDQKSGTSTDYVMVVDANLGSKSNRSVIRQTTYDVSIQPDGSLQSRLALDYEFFARVAEKDPAVRPQHYNDIDYHSLLQIFTPANTDLIDANGFPGDPQIVTSETHTAFVSYVTVDYDTSARFQIAYETPALVEYIGPYRRYTLTLQKQPGTIADYVNVQVTLPSGANTVKISPAPSATFEIDSPILEFRMRLVTDETIEIVYRD